MATRIPSPGKWSILECVEHVAISEDRLFSFLHEAKDAGVPQLNRPLETMIREHGADRNRRVESPADVLPAARFSTVSEALQHFLESRKHTILFVQANREDLRAKVVAHPLFGVVTGYEILLLAATHPLRHAKQIEEIKSLLA
jgi:hypothetical protein